MTALAGLNMKKPSVVASVPLTGTKLIADLAQVGC